MKKCSLLQVLAVFCLISVPCFAGKNNEKTDVQYPYLSRECADGEIIKTYAKGKILKKFDKVPSEFPHAVVFECEEEYYLNKEVRTSVYQLVYSGVKKNNKVSEVLDLNAEFGTAADKELKLICRSKNLDEYLISCSTALPVEYNGYYYFLPGMLLNTTMKYLDFMDIHEYDFKELYDHTVIESDEEGWTPGASFVRWNVYLSAPLENYPLVLSNPEYYANVQLESYLDIEYEGVKIKMYFQPGFKQFLEDECKIGDTVYYYLLIDTVDFFSKSYTAYVRDFSVISPDEIIEGRLNIIKQELNIE